ncbi:MAG: 1-deoxy-D-xylulose-5-phosphate reductoisomerase [Acetivibrionales bacterium]|jgi:1-deoxy-D-xylulose-5-phosphate reductoisomerase|nr:1-deoxy-D-xylulose-5-phosphate reductoisomerase [Bacillota bacterium]NLP07949.1 1-deoxy-D-xylulose-5-phosphate reductoisomerase [Clostridiaceae bacterium]HOA54632.1 1-deoxy-D-xylulose-5-phosphate reductoisomerase [Clostridiales bacterium]HQD30329.1 1-deoxy-D-xylulose-5-phosphate reductoisomerase [Clostridiales bacterium]
MADSIALLGSTGSIGVQTLDVARNLGIKVSALTAYSDIDLLEKQAREFRPPMVAIGDDTLAPELENRLKGLGIQVLSGPEGIRAAAAVDGVDKVVVAIVGIAGLLPTIEAIRNGRDVALANKETLVTAGHIVMAEAESRGVTVFPVDSEHSAVYQCLAGNRKQDVERLLLTASGGPFRGMGYDELRNVTAEQALKHPNWSMGSKITIDSATMMNKGLEVIEARWLFGFSPEKISVLVHPQSIIHSMVEYKDGSVIAQLGQPDMRIPIQLSLTWPERCANEFPRLDLIKSGVLTFEEPDMEKFRCLRLAYDALEEGGTMPAVLNGANEAAVKLFLEGRIGFCAIPQLIEKTMLAHEVNTSPELDDIIEVDKWAKRMVGDSVCI